MQRGGRYRSFVDEARRRSLRVWCPSSLDELREVAEGIVLRRPAAVAVVGGDGSLREVVSAVHRACAGSGAVEPSFIFIPAGTISTVVRNWSRGALHRARLLEQILAGTTPLVTSRPTLFVRLSSGHGYVSFVFGAGLVPRFFEEYERGRTRGRWSAAAIGARAFTGVWTRSPFARELLAPVPCRIGVDGALQPETSYSLVTCAVVRNLGLHFIVNYRAAEDPHRPHLVATSLPAFALGRQTLRVLRGRPLRSSRGLDGLVSQCELAFPDRTAIVLDGDTFRVDSLTITAGPVLRVAC